MRVDAINRAYEAYSTQKVTASSKTNKVASKDQVALSSQAKDFTSIYKQLQDVQEVRQDKVDTIKERMANGTYNVTAQEVASKMLAQYNIKG